MVSRAAGTSAVYAADTVITVEIDVLKSGISALTTRWPTMLGENFDIRYVVWGRPDYKGGYRFSAARLRWMTAPEG